MMGNLVTALHQLLIFKLGAVISFLKVTGLSALYQHHAQAAVEMPSNALVSTTIGTDSIALFQM